MRALVLLNAAAGTLAAMSEVDPILPIVSALNAFDIEAEIRVLPAPELTAAAAEAATRSYDAVIGGGGDGTLSAIAGALAGTKMPLGVLPLGTLNHFAKDLKIPMHLADAAWVVAQRRIAQVDVAEVNGRVFLNNSSLGLYPRMVIERDGQRQRGLVKMARDDMGYA
ncbi:MAG: diacylglycerol kinase family protein [Pirellulales bacterium]